jgi:prepilin-type processing-associated H-X9-DG protein
LPPGGFPAWVAEAGYYINNGDFSQNVRMLPYLEQSTVYNAANFNFAAFNSSVGDLTNNTLYRVRMNVFLCPSSTAPSWNIEGTGAQLTSLTAVGSNYFGSMGASLEFDSSFTGGPPNGLFAYQGTSSQMQGNGNSITTIPSNTSAKPPTLAAITDGTSNTVAYGEWKTGTGNLNTVTIPQDIIFTGQYPPGDTRNTPMMQMHLGGAAVQQWFPICASLAPTNRQGKTATLGEDYISALVGYAWGNLVAPPNPKFPNCDTDGSVGTLANPGTYGLSSYHPGGANVLMGDGSVRFLKDSIGSQPLWALGTRAGGEIISADSY